MMTTIFNRTEEKDKRRKLRNNMTKAEEILWERLRRRQVKGKRFLRQFSVCKYVIDFYCPELRFVSKHSPQRYREHRDTQRLFIFKNMKL